MNTQFVLKLLMAMAATHFLATQVSAASKPTAVHQDLAPVKGFAQSFLSTAPIANGTIRVLETGEEYKTNDKGEFGPIWHKIGKPITLTFSKKGFKTTQSGTIVVPPKGLTDQYHQISFQVPSNVTFRLFAFAIGADIHDDSCHVATTITAKNKTLLDVPQGEEGAQVVLNPKVKEKPYYFGMFKIWPIYGKTNPLAKGLDSVSEDGGVAFVNLPPRKELYVLTAKKEGHTFTSAKFICRQGAFINISPPQGPTVVS